MKAIENNASPAIVMDEWDYDGKPRPVMHCMDIDSARKLRDELTDVIKRCVVLESVRPNDQAEARRTERNYNANT